MQLNHGAPRQLDSSVDFAVYTNEQFGFTSLIAADGHFAYATPFPSGIDLQNQTIQLQRLDKGQHQYEPNTRQMQALTTYLSMLDEEYGDFVGGELLDANDEEFRAQFDGQITYGWMYNTFQQAGADASDYMNAVHADFNTLIHFYPAIKQLDLLTPLYQQEVNISFAVSAAPGTHPAAVNFAAQESVYQRLWYDVRNLTSTEKNMRGNQLQWMRLNS